MSGLFSMILRISRRGLLSGNKAGEKDNLRKYSYNAESLNMFRYSVFCSHENRKYN